MDGSRTLLQQDEKVLRVSDYRGGGGGGIKNMYILRNSLFQSA